MSGFVEKTVAEQGFASSWDLHVDADLVAAVKQRQRRMLFACLATGISAGLGIVALFLQGIVPEDSIFAQPLYVALVVALAALAAIASWVTLLRPGAELAERVWDAVEGHFAALFSRADNDAFAEVIIQDLAAIIQTNLTSAFLALKTAGKAMLKSGTGRMVFTSSVAGSYGLTNHEAIAAAKGGVEAMVRAAASTYAQRGLRVNAVAPGLTETRLGATVLRSDAIREASVGMIPLKRINEANEIAQSMHWLLTGAPDNFTGQVLHLDGGMSNIRG